MAAQQERSVPASPAPRSGPRAEPPARRAARIGVDIDDRNFDAFVDERERDCLRDARASTR